MPRPCQSCGYDNRLAAVYCGGCGRPLGATAACPNCGRSNPPGHRHCDGCGTRLDSAEPTLAPASQPAVTTAQLGVEPTRRLSASAIATFGITAALAVAVFARFYGLGATPDYLLDAEQALGEAARDVLDSGWIGLRSDDLGRQPTGVAYLMSLWVRAFGEDGVVLRFVVAATGVATLALLFAFCRRFLGLRAAVLATVLLAFSAWHLQFSRIALPAAFLPMIGLAAAYLTVSGLEGPDWRKSLRALALGGVLTGIGFYVHNAFWLFAIAAAVLWAREFLAGESPIEAVSRKALAFTVPALIVALPYFLFLTLNWADATDHFRDISVTGVDEFQDRNGLPEQSRYLAAEWARSVVALLGRLDLLSTALALVGLAVAMSRIRQRAYALLWALLAVTTLGVALTTDAGIYSQMMPALPAVFAMAGVGMDWLLTWTMGRLTLAAQYALVALAITFVASTNLTSFYDEPAGSDETLLATNVRAGNRSAPLLSSRGTEGSGVAAWSLVSSLRRKPESRQVNVQDQQRAVKSVRARDQ